MDLYAVYNILISIYYILYMWQGRSVSDMTAYVVGGQKMNKCG